MPLEAARRMERKPGTSGKSFLLPPDRRNGESTAPRMLKIECERELGKEGRRDLDKGDKELALFRGEKRRRLAMEEVGLKGGDFLKHESDDELVLVHKRTWLQGCARLREVEIQERELKSGRDALVESEKKVTFVINTLDGRINVVEEREKELNLLMRELRSKEEEMSKTAEEFVHQVKMADHKLLNKLMKLVEKEREFVVMTEKGMKELELKEKQLDMKKEEFVREVEQVDRKFRMREEGLRHDCMNRLNMSESKIEAVKKNVDKKVEEIESICNAGWKIPWDTIKETELIRESVEKQLDMKKEEFVREVEQVDSKFRMREEGLRHDCMNRLNMSESKIEAVKKNVDKKVEEIESICNAGWKIPWDTIKETELIRESVEKQFEELEKMKREFDSFQEKRMGELASKELQLCMMSKELVEDARSRDERLKEREKLGSQLVKRLDSALDLINGLKSSVEEKWKKIVSEEAQVQSIREWVDGKMDELDSRAVESLEQEKTILEKEKFLKSKDNELHLREKDLNLKEESLLSQQMDLELKEREFESASADLEWKEKNLKSVKEFVHKCFKEHVAVKKEALTEKDLAEKLARHLKQKEDQLESREKEIMYKEKQLIPHLKEPELKLLEWNYPIEANRNLKSGDYADLKFIVTMNGKTLQMLLNDQPKDLDLMRNEILIVLHLSSDPAKIVLDAMMGFYPPHLRREDSESNVQKTCIMLLEQLFRMSPKINPRVREEALELAREWKSKMSVTTENLRELVGFLRLLAAYNLTSYFDENEVKGFVTKVTQHS